MTITGERCLAVVLGMRALQSHAIRLLQGVCFATGLRPPSYKSSRFYHDYESTKTITARTSLHRNLPIASLAMHALTLDKANLFASTGKREARLTAREFGVLEMLHQAAGDAVAHEALLDKVWRPNTPIANLRVAIAGLRRKLEPDPELPVLILSVPKVGYRLAGAPGPTRTGTSCDKRF